MENYIKIFNKYPNFNYNCYIKLNIFEDEILNINIFEDLDRKSTRLNSSHT